MTNKEIIEQLENAIDLIKQDGKDWLDDRDIPILEACIKSLTAYECGEHANEWISVSEKLPKAFEFVNCTCHSLIDDREDWVVETVYVPQSPDSPYSDLYKKVFPTVAPLLANNISPSCNIYSFALSIDNDNLSSSFKELSSIFMSVILIYRGRFSSKTFPLSLAPY